MFKKLDHAALDGMLLGAIDLPDLTRPSHHSSLSSVVRFFFGPPKHIQTYYISLEVFSVWTWLFVQLGYYHWALVTGPTPLVP